MAIQAMAQEPIAGGDGNRTAASSLSPLILKLVQDQMQGKPLDAAGESAARRQHWQSPK